MCSPDFSALRMPSACRPHAADCLTAPRRDRHNNPAISVKTMYSSRGTKPEEIRRRMKMTGYLIKSTIVGALGGLLFGFDTAVIAGTTQQLTVIYHLTAFTLGLTVFIGLAGTVLGAMTAGILGQRIGGREALRIMAILYTISALGCAL